jgi:hypothetical protein
MVSVLASLAIQLLAGQLTTANSEIEWRRFGSRIDIAFWKIDRATRDKSGAR